MMSNQTSISKGNNLRRGQQRTDQEHKRVFDDGPFFTLGLSIWKKDNRKAERRTKQK